MIDEKTKKAYVNLISAIILNAIKDLSSNNKYNVGDAIVFIKSNRCKTMCECIDFNYDRVVKKAKEIVTSKGCKWK